MKGFPLSSVGKESACNAQVRFLGQEDALEKEMATHSSILALENPVDRGAWQATVHGVARVEHDLATTPPPLYFSNCPVRMSPGALLKRRVPGHVRWTRIPTSGYGEFAWKNSARRACRAENLRPERTPPTSGLKSP